MPRSKLADDRLHHSGWRIVDLVTAKTDVLAQSFYTSLGWQRDEIFDAASKRI